MVKITQCFHKRGFHKRGCYFDRNLFSQGYFKSEGVIDINPHNIVSRITIDDGVYHTFTHTKSTYFFGLFTTYTPNKVETKCPTHYKYNMTDGSSILSTNYVVF